MRKDLYQFLILQGIMLTEGTIDAIYSYILNDDLVVELLINYLNISAFERRTMHQTSNKLLGNLLVRYRHFVKAVNYENAR